MKKLFAMLIAASFASGVAFAASHAKKEEMKKPTAEECKKAAEAKKNLEGCPKAEAKK
jgi:hypothetical protein